MFQLMLQFGQGHGLPSAHLLFGLLQERHFFRSEDVIRVNQLLRFYEDAVCVRRKADKTALFKPERRTDFPGDNNLPALTNAANRLPYRGGGLGAHAFKTIRSSDTKKTPRAAGQEPPITELIRLSSNL